MAANQISNLFTGSPFSLVATVEGAACWAGRGDVLAQLQKLCRSWSNRADSSVDLMWANLGAGKTHALLHLSSLLKLENESPPIVVFVELPEHLRNFAELYSRIVRQLPLHELMTDALQESAGISLELQRASRAYVAGGTPGKQVVEDWITGGRPHLKDLRATTGIAARIETDAQAEQSLTELLHICARQRRRVVLLVDEFQRIGHLPQKARESLLSHLRGVLSRCSAYFSIVFAVGSRMERTALDLLSPELKTIMGVRPLISLPSISQDEASGFVLERLAWFRPSNFNGDKALPFTDAMIKSAVNFLANEANLKLTPRVLLQTFGLLSDEIQDGAIDLSNEDNVFALLRRYRWDTE